MAENQYSKPTSDSSTAGLFTTVLDNLSTVMVSSDSDVRSQAYDALARFVHHQSEAIEALIGS